MNVFTAEELRFCLNAVNGVDCKPEVLGECLDIQSEFEPIPPLLKRKFDALSADQVRRLNTELKQH